MVLKVELRKRVGDTLLHPQWMIIYIYCHPSEMITLRDGRTDGVDQTHRNVMEKSPLSQPGWTALHVASARAHYQCVQSLLAAAGTDASAQDQLCRTPLDVAGYEHYMGHNIDVDNLMKTVDLLLKAGGKFQNCCYESDPEQDTPLHTAVELESEAAVEQMLQGGASVTVRNSQGLTAMHICVKKRNKELLQLLANHKHSNVIQHLPTVDAKDGTGATVLCAAVEAKWMEGVRIALTAGATNMEAHGESAPIYKYTPKYVSEGILEHCTLLTYERTSHNQLDTYKGRSGETNVIHLAIQLGSRDILEYLLNYPYKKTNITKIINTSDRFGPPLNYALIYNRPDCARLLISKGAEVHTLLDCYSINCNNNLTRMSFLHVAAIKNQEEIAEMIIKHDSETVHFTVAGRTPLHEACRHGNKKIIELLLRNGADLSGGENVNESYYFAKPREFIPIELLMNNVSKPTEFLQEIFDSYITSKGQSNCEVVVDYRVLFPKPDMIHMGVIKALNNTGNRYGQDRLLLHPLVQSFLYLKWRSVLSFFYGTLALHVCFVLSLNVFVLSLFWYKDKNKETEPVPFKFPLSVWIYIIYLTACLLTIQEIIIINMKSKRYLLCLETLVKLLSTTLAVILPQIVSWDSKPNPEWVRLFCSATLLLTWVRMMFLLSRFPVYGYYFLMYGKVATKVFKILVSFGFLIFGFAISFMIQFHAQEPFEDPWSSLLLTMVMMTSEFGYADLINKKNVEKASASVIMIRLIFLAFLILVSIILMNLLVGVAVSDVNNLEIIGKINRLVKQVEFITSFEDIGCNIFIKKIFPTRLYERWFKNTRWRENRFVLRPRETTWINGLILPAHLKEAIFEKAQFQKRQSDEEQGTMLYQMKLDEIHKVIVKKDCGELHKSEGPDNALNKLVEDINKMRSDIEIIKNFIDTTTHRNQARDEVEDPSTCICLIIEITEYRTTRVAGVANATGPVLESTEIQVMAPNHRLVQ